MKCIDKDFPTVFAACLNDEAWLPFLTSVRYQATPSISLDAADVEKTFQQGGSFDFCFNIGTEAPFGRLCVAPICVDYERGTRVVKTNCFTVTQMNPYYAGLSGRHAKSGLGREFIRRVVYFADQYGSACVKVIVRAPELCSFLFAHGFHSPNLIYPKWSNVGCTEKFKECWTRQLREKPGTAWGFARTKIGRKVLSGVAGSMTLNLLDTAQRSRAAHCLKLPLICKHDN